MSISVVLLANRERVSEVYCHKTSKMIPFEYLEFDADAPIADFVKRFWRFDNLSSTQRSYTILPDGYFDVIISIKGAELLSVTLFGVWTREIEVVIPGGTTVMGICFKPLAAEHILRQSIVNELNSFKILRIDYWQLIDIPFNDFQKWTVEVSRLMQAKPEQLGTVDNRKQEVFCHLFDRNGAITVAELAATVFWNSRQINRYFKEWFGITLKAYANILRCASVYSEIREGQLYPNAEFYDQAHFIKEIKKHTGHSPMQLYRNENDRFLQFLTLPKS